MTGTAARRLLLGMVGAVVALAAVTATSIAVGSKSIPLGTVVTAMTSYNGTLDDHVIVHDLRLPRTLLGLAVGAALGLAGTLIQALTRNPLADPGILGINEGAALGVVVSVAVTGLTSPLGYIWFAFAGAAVSAVMVYAVGARGREGASPVRLVLAGIAFTYVLHGITFAILLTDTAAFDRWRNWSAGSLAAADPDALMGVLPFLAVGALLALALSRSLNALALGDEAGQALGVHRGRTRLLGAVAVTLLCGAATAAAGPIGFVGLMVPYLARMITGPDYRWLLPYSLVLAPILVLGADILGRVLARPSEIGVGVITAFVGAPLLIAMVRRRGRLPQL
ncbi:iron ABC transporter permease [Phytohabitans aurantiacus]|uniref:Iron ABC transporter permease n=1 Tax=Phytohabitans aurantiacus TaxID=3016789 RepID=A0ABQ5QNV3_9ACTN|nr:iron chelate uptake ABC transporter family permease subunit [Phytohabitans aurantiacus]GLH95914.1 iron ABC transporter permease [Phytohabitans aurantiacus]